MRFTSFKLIYLILQDFPTSGIRLGDSTVDALNLHCRLTYDNWYHKSQGM